MLAICPKCDKLVPCAPAPRDPLGKPRVTIATHDHPPACRQICKGSGKLV